MRYGTTSHSIHSVQFSGHYLLFLYYRQFVVVLVICRCRMQKSTTLAAHVVHQLQRTIGGAEAGAGTVIGSTAIGAGEAVGLYSKEPYTDSRESATTGSGAAAFD